MSKEHSVGGLALDWPYRSTFMWLDIRACQDANGDGMGDIPGLISRLPHFQEVGVGCLLFPGLMPSDFAYAGTMMTDFCRVDPRFGTLADFDRLIEEAHRLGIAILVGWSPFSTHPDHPYFQASRDRSHPDFKKYRDYYLWTSDVNSRLPRRWGHWEWDERRKAYHHTVWLTVDKRWCPEVNLTSKVAREENRKVVTFWLDRGADGFWVDCGVWGGFTSEEAHVQFSREMTDLVHSYPAKWIISEGSKSIRDTIERDGYDSLFGDQARTVPVYKTVFRREGAGTLAEFFEGMESHGIHEALYSFYDDPHGNQVMHPSKLTVPLDFADPVQVRKTRLCMAIEATLPMVPITRFPQHAGLDREKRSEHVNVYPFLMMWDDSPNHGFSAVDPYIKQNAEGFPASVSAAAQLADPESVLSGFKAANRLRRENRALQCHAPVAESYGRLPTSDDDNSFSYVRHDPETAQVMIVATNLTAEEMTLRLEPSRSARVVRFLRGRRQLIPRLGDGVVEAVDRTDGTVTLRLPGYGYSVLEVVE